MDVNPIVLSIPVYFLLIGIELLVQYFSNRKLYRLNDAITNISCGITQQVSGAFIKILTIGAYQYAFEHWSLFEIPVTWWSVLILYLGVDLCYYWGHRMSHEVNIMWGGHVVHHQSEDYNFSVALRQGSFQSLWTFWFYIPLAILGFDTITFLLISAFNTVYQFWIHTETISKLPKPIEWIFNTPSHHRVHHGRDPKYIDKNHAGSLIIWDKLFGTFQEEQEKPTYGITKPLNTWNPVWANLQHYKDLGQQFIATPGVSNKLNILFNKPGWKPAEEGGPLKVEPTSNTYQKYDNRPPGFLGIYVMIQFVIILIATSIFLFKEHIFLSIEKLSFAGMIVLSVLLFGMLLDNKTKWIVAEFIRILLFMALAYTLNAPFWLMVLTATIGILSSISLFLFIERHSSTINKAS